MHHHAKQQPAGPENKTAFSQLFQPVWVQWYHIHINPCWQEMKLQKWNEQKKPEIAASDRSLRE